MVSADQICQELLNDVRRFAREVKEIFTRLVLPTWGSELHGLPDTLYGYMLGTFARIDLTSAYWRGSDAGKQTDRMVSFMEVYLGRSRDLCSVAVQMWRHTLVHTAQPRPLRDPTNGVVYRWLLHWRDHLPENQHFKFMECGRERILNLGLMYLIEDLERGIKAYAAEVAIDTTLQNNIVRFEQELSNQALRL